ncbi:MAG: RelA/SpoT family protein, partial [Cytophagales bacterium]|nr:RelA/SpoT family protein [Cytophagales bacterium]
MELLVEEDVERKEILRQYRKLLRTAKPYLKDDDAKIIKKAFNTSLEAHKDMRRKSGEPYIIHPLAVAQIVVEEMGLGTTAIVSALLHDVVEDTEMEISDIEKHFGPKVAKIIDGLTKISGVFEKSGSLQAENFRKLILTLSDDVRVILIKIADRLHNMRTLDSMPRDKQLKIASETIYLYAPLAHRLGLYPIKSELEDHYLKYTDPIVYKGIALKLKQTKAARNKFIKDFTEPIERELGKAGFDYIVKGRPKSIYSIWNKIKKQNIHFEDIYDLFAIRIIIKTPVENEKSGCWRVYSLVTDIYKPNPDRLRDWISTPRSNGYESLHTTVMSKTGQWVEVQIRSERMDEIAEKGYAAHWKYKDTPSAQGSEKGIELWFSKIRDMLSNTSRKGSLDFVDEFKSNLFSEEVFVFTPKGELRVLPNGATALDFAFEIHSQIGAKCLGAKVNQKLVPLSYVMNNGDQIEILTSTKQHPNEDWLNFVTTSKARAKIKDYLKEEVRKVALEGKEMVERRFRNLKIEFNNDNVNRLANIFHEKSSQDLYYKVAKGQIDLKNVRDLSDPKEEKQNILTKSDKPDVKKVIEFEPTSKKSPFNELLFGD